MDKNRILRALEDAPTDDLAEIAGAALALYVDRTNGRGIRGVTDFAMAYAGRNHLESAAEEIAALWDA